MLDSALDARRSAEYKLRMQHDTGELKVRKTTRSPRHKYTHFTQTHTQYVSAVRTIARSCYLVAPCLGRWTRTDARAVQELLVQAQSELGELQGLVMLCERLQGRV